jgi:hypothetical protein
MDGLNLLAHGAVRLQHHGEHWPTSSVDRAQLNDLSVGVLAEDASRLDVDDDRVRVRQPLRRPLLRGLLG